MWEMVEKCHKGGTEMTVRPQDSHLVIQNRDVDGNCNDRQSGWGS
jgi:hypothetical protein